MSVSGFHNRKQGHPQGKGRVDLRSMGRPNHDMYKRKRNQPTTSKEMIIILYNRAERKEEDEERKSRDC